MSQILDDNYWVGEGAHPALFLTNPNELAQLIEEAFVTKNAEQMLACLNNPNISQTFLMETLFKLLEHRFPNQSEPMDSMILALGSGWDEAVGKRVNNLNFYYHLASLGNLTIEALNLLAMNGTYLALLGLANRYMLEEETILLLLKRYNKPITELLAATCQLTPTIISVIVEEEISRGTSLSNHLAKNPTLPTEYIEQFLPRFKTVACNPKVTGEQLKELYWKDSANPHIFTNPNLPVNIFTHTVENRVIAPGEPWLTVAELEGMLMNPNIPVEQIREKLDPDMATIRGILKYNWLNMPAEHIVQQILSGDIVVKTLWFNSEPTLSTFRKKDWLRMLVKFLTLDYPEVHEGLPCEWLEELALNSLDESK